MQERHLLQDAFVIRIALGDPVGSVIFRRIADVLFGLVAGDCFLLTRRFGQGLVGRFLFDKGFGHLRHCLGSFAGDAHDSFLVIEQSRQITGFRINDGSDLRSDIHPRFVAFDLQGNLVNSIGAGHEVRKSS